MRTQVLAIIGEQFNVGNEICGAVISVRYNEDIISLWNRNADNDVALTAIRCVLVLLFVWVCWVYRHILPCADFV